MTDDNTMNPAGAPAEPTPETPAEPTPAPEQQM